MYFDAILDNRYMPIFNDTRENCIKWLRDKHARGEGLNQYTCVPGETMEQLTVDDYMIRYAEVAN